MLAPAKNPTVLIIDDSDVDREAARRLLNSTCHVLEASTATEGLAICEAHRPGCVLLDHRLPDIDGIEILPALLATDVSVIMLTGQGSESVAVASLRLGAHDYLPKRDLDATVLHRAIRNAVIKAELMAQLHTFREVSERSPLGILVLERRSASNPLSHHVTWANEAARRDFELDVGSIFGSTLRQVLPALGDDPGFADALAAVAAGQHARLAGVHLGKKVFDVRLVPLAEGRMAVIAENITEQQLLEVQLRQAQKMEAVGQLAGGVAHDFNNLLTAVFSYSSFAMECLNPEEPMYADLMEIRKAAERAARLTRQLLTFSRCQTAKPTVVAVNDLVRDMDRMLRRILGEHIELVTGLGSETGDVKIDITHLEQVVVNLAVNARDAMRDGGRLTIETTNRVLDEPHVTAQGTAVPPGEYAQITVSDSGEGIDPQTQLRIFEPFFTTKGESHGTGLGLSTCYGIVRQAGGYIWVSSEVGDGTTFTILLPRIVGVSKRVERAQPSLRPAGGSETVLVSEDDAQVRALVVRALTRSGYEVLEAPNGGEAFLVAEQRRAPIHLLVTDMIMPRLCGRRLAARVCGLHPETRVLYISGYTSAASISRNRLEEGDFFLQKPFGPEQLLAKVREVLDADDPA